MHDIYDPPPAPVPWEPPKPEPLTWTGGDVACLAILSALVITLSVFAGMVDPSLAALTLFGGVLVILESWFTAIGYLHRHPTVGLRKRWLIVLAAMAPWVIGLGVAAALMLGLFAATDWVWSWFWT